MLIVVRLHGGATEVGLVGASRWLPYLLLGLSFGAENANEPARRSSAIRAFQAPAEDPNRVDSQDRSERSAVRILRARQRFGSSADHDRARAPWWQDVVDDERNVRVGRSVAELGRVGKVTSRYVDRVQCGVVGPAQRYDMGQPVSIDGGQCPSRRPSRYARSAAENTLTAAPAWRCGD